MCPLLAQLIIGFFFFAVAVYSTHEANKAGGTCRYAVYNLRCLWFQRRRWWICLQLLFLGRSCKTLFTLIYTLQSQNFICRWQEFTAKTHQARTYKKGRGSFLDCDVSHQCKLQKMKLYKIRLWSKTLMDHLDCSQQTGLSNLIKLSKLVCLSLTVNSTLV
jgi:hypothetical protein